MTFQDFEYPYYSKEPLDSILDFRLHRSVHPQLCVKDQVFSNGQSGEKEIVLLNVSHQIFRPFTMRLSIYANATFHA